MTSSINKRIFLIIFPLFYILIVTWNIEQVNWVSYSSYAFYLYFILTGFKETKSKELKFSLLIIASFGIWAMVTALWSPYPWESFKRSIIFIVASWGLIMAGYYWVRNFSKKEFTFLIPLNILVIVLSVFSLFTKIPHDYWAGYGFGLKSFFGHQNALASLIIFTIPGIFFLPLKDRRIRLIVTMILSFLNVYILILTHSRTSIAILFLSVLLFTLLSRRFKVFVLVILILTSVTTFYLVNKNFRGIINNYVFKTEVSLLDRKMPVFSASYNAARHGGWNGLGYEVSDSTVLSGLQYNVHYRYYHFRLMREKGVSIFALIEETGWIGLILFLLFVGYLFYLSILTYLNTMDWTSALMICILFGMCLHAQFEGWWLTVSSVRFPLFMGLAGIAIGKFRIDSEKK